MHYRAWIYTDLGSINTFFISVSVLFDQYREKQVEYVIRTEVFRLRKPP